MNIYDILSSVPHNKFYLDRYIKFINYCRETNNKISSEYYEKHHILPKAKELFPQYKSFKENPWNCIILTSRQHFICHQILHKCFGGSQTFSFLAMINQKSKYQTQRYSKINSRAYQTLKENTRRLISETNKGKSSYKDEDGNIYHCSTTDPRVLSGELISLTKGRKHKSRKKPKIRKKYFNSKDPNKIVKLYFLDIRIEVLYHSDIFIEYLEQGWVMNRTKEYKVKQIKELHCGRKRSSATRLKLSNSRKGKARNQSKEERYNRRKTKDQKQLYYNTETKSFEEIDLLFCETPEIYLKVFTKTNSRIIFDINGNKRFCSKLVPTPDNYYDVVPSKTFKIFNLKTKEIDIKCYHQIDKNKDIILKVHNGKQIRFYCDKLKANIYLDKDFIEKYGIPINCH